MDKDTFLITGEIEQLKQLAKKMEEELFKPAEEEDIDFEAIGRFAEEASDPINNLINETLDDE